MNSLLVLATTLGGCPSSSETSAEFFESLLVLGESNSSPEPRQESAQGYSFSGGSLTLAKSFIAEILWPKVTKTSSQYVRKPQALKCHPDSGHSKEITLGVYIKLNQCCLRLHHPRLISRFCHWAIFWQNIQRST